MIEIPYVMDAIKIEGNLLQRKHCIVEEFDIFLDDGCNVDWIDKFFLADIARLIHVNFE